MDYQGGKRASSNEFKEHIDKLLGRLGEDFSAILVLATSTDMSEVSTSIATNESDVKSVVLANTFSMIEMAHKQGIFGDSQYHAMVCHALINAFTTSKEKQDIQLLFDTYRSVIAYAGSVEVYMYLATRDEFKFLREFMLKVVQGEDASDELTLATGRIEDLVEDWASEN